MTTCVCVEVVSTSKVPEALRLGRMRIQPGTIARVLSKLRRPKIDLQTQFEVPDTLWKRLQSYAAREGPHNEAPQDLFQLSRGPKQKALVGSLLLENGAELPLSLEIQYLQSLIDVGLAPEAIRLYKHKRLTSSEDRQRWHNFGIELYCHSFRPKVAESLAQKSATSVSNCLAFIKVYSEMRHANVRTWLETLLAIKPNAETTNRALRLLIDARMWDQVQYILVEMNRIGHIVHPKLSVACFEAASAFPIDSSALPGIVTLLEADGSLVNVPRFRRAIAGDPKSRLNLLLKNNDIEGALKVYREIEGPQVLPMAFSFLEYAISMDEPQILANVIPRIMNNPSYHKNSIYIQFMLDYAEYTKDYSHIWQLMSKKHPLHLHMSYENYRKLWQILLRHLRQGGSVGALREFVANTVSKVALQPAFLRLMILSLNTVPDLPAIASLLQYADENCGIDLKQLKIHPGSEDSWRELAQAFADQQHTDLESAISAARDFQRSLQI